MFKTKIVSLFLVPAVAAYSAVAGLLYKGTGESLFDIEALKTTAVLSLACALAQDILPRSFKEAVVFWRTHDRVPGHRAFLKVKNDRYDLRRIINHEKLAALPPGDQQRIFYQIYKKHRDDPKVAHCSFRYCAWRDTASLFFCLAVVTVPAALVVSRSIVQVFAWRPAMLLAASAAFAYLLTTLAARQVAGALVDLTLSCETAEQPHAVIC